MYRKNSTKNYNVNEKKELLAILPGYENYVDVEKALKGEVPCPFCGGKTRFRIKDGLFYCSHCAPEMKNGGDGGDLIAFHIKWSKEKLNKPMTLPQLCEKYLQNPSRAGKNLQKQPPKVTAYNNDTKQVKVIDWESIPSGQEKDAITLLCHGRGIDRNIISELFKAGQIKIGKHYGKDAVYIPYKSIEGETFAVQYIAVKEPFSWQEPKDSNKPVNKMFGKGDKVGDDCFFRIGATIQDSTKDLIISESAINAITAHQCFPDACSLALGSSNYTKKLECLKSHINGRKVIVCGDNDDAGQKMADAVRQTLGDTVHAIRFDPEDKSGCDINDLLKAGQKERIISLINDAIIVPGEEDKIKALLEDALKRSESNAGVPYEPEIVKTLGDLYQNNMSKFKNWMGKFNKIKNVSAREITNYIKGSDESSESTQADRIVNLVKEKASFSHDPEGNNYIIIKDVDHEEIYLVGSTVADNKIKHMVYSETQSSISDQAIKTANGIFSCLGEFGGKEEPVFLRAGFDKDNHYIDLCNDKWQVVQINQFGWQVIDRSPVRFRRTKTMQAIPIPDGQPDLPLLWKYINVRAADKLFILVFILECWRFDTQKPIFELTGGQGTGKSNIAETLRDLIDPNSVNLRARPKQIDDIFVSATNNWIVNCPALNHQLCWCDPMRFDRPWVR